MFSYSPLYIYYRQSQPQFLNNSLIFPKSLLPKELGLRGPAGITINPYHQTTYAAQPVVLGSTKKMGLSLLYCFADVSVQFVYSLDKPCLYSPAHSSQHHIDTAGRLLFRVPSFRVVRDIPLTFVSVFNRMKYSPLYFCIRRLFSVS